MGLRKKLAWGSCLYNDPKINEYVLLPYMNGGKKLCV